MKESQNTLQGKKRAVDSELAILLNEHRREKEDWEKLREELFEGKREVEKKLAVLEAENDGMKRQFGKLSESLQKSVSKTLFAQI